MLTLALLAWTYVVGAYSIGALTANELDPRKWSGSVLMNWVPVLTWPVSMPVLILLAHLNR